MPKRTIEYPRLKTTLNGVLDEMRRTYMDAAERFRSDVEAGAMDPAEMTRRLRALEDAGLIIRAAVEADQADLFA